MPRPLASSKPQNIETTEYRHEVRLLAHAKHARHPF